MSAIPRVIGANIRPGFRPGGFTKPLGQSKGEANTRKWEKEKARKERRLREAIAQRPHQFPLGI